MSTVLNTQKFWNIWEKALHMNERQYVLAANILNKHGAQVERSEIEKWETLRNIQKPSDQTLSLVGKRIVSKFRHGKEAKSTLPSFTKTEPRNHLRITAPESLQQTLQLKVYTNRDRQPPVPVPTTTMTNTIPCSHSEGSSPRRAQARLHLRAKCQTGCGKPSLSLPDSCNI